MELQGQRIQRPNPLPAQIQLWTWLCTRSTRRRTSGVERAREAKDEKRIIRMGARGAIRSGEKLMDDMRPPKLGSPHAANGFPGEHAHEH